MKPPMPVRDPADAATSSSAERDPTRSKSESKTGSKSGSKSGSKTGSGSASGSKSGPTSASSSHSTSGPSGDKSDRSVSDKTPNFGRFRLVGRIGEGGMAEVYRAVMTGPEGFERELVLKRILPRLS